MKLFMQMRPILIIIYVVFLLSLGGCQPNRPSQPNQHDRTQMTISSNGGEDAGAGNPDNASSSEVVGSIERMWQLAISRPHFFESIRNQIRGFTASELNLTDKQLERLLVINHRILGGPSIRRGLTEETTRPDKYLLGSKITFNFDGPCEAKDNHNGTASVSKFEYGADICFSIFRLTSIPRSSINLEILGLLVHEMAHLSGYGESDAVLIQRAVVHRASLYFSTVYSASIIDRIVRLTRSATYKLNLIEAHIRSGNSDEQLLELTSILDGFKLLADEINENEMSRIALSPARNIDVNRFIEMCARAQKSLRDKGEFALQRNQSTETMLEAERLNLFFNADYNLNLVFDAASDLVNFNFPGYAEKLTAASKKPSNRKEIEAEYYAKAQSQGFVTDSETNKKQL